MSKMALSAAVPVATDVPILVGGRFEQSSSTRHGEVFNPSTGRVLARVPLCTAS